MLISFWLIWTAVYVPMKVGFGGDTTPISWIIFDTIIDTCFLIDVVLSFFTAIENKDGSYEVRKCRIAANYLKLWFWIDFLSSLPI